MAGYLVDKANLSTRRQARAGQTPEDVYPTVLEMRERFAEVIKTLVNGSTNPYLEDDTFLDWLWDENNSDPAAMTFRAAHPDLSHKSQPTDYPPFDDMSSVLAAYLWVETVRHRQGTPKQ